MSASPRLPAAARPRRTPTDCYDQKPVECQCPPNWRPDRYSGCVPVRFSIALAPQLQGPQPGTLGRPASTGPAIECPAFGTWRYIVSTAGIALGYAMATTAQAPIFALTASITGDFAFTAKLGRPDPIACRDSINRQYARVSTMPACASTSHASSAPRVSLAFPASRGESPESRAC